MMLSALSCSGCTREYRKRGERPFGIRSRVDTCLKTHDQILTDTFNSIGEPSLRSVGGAQLKMGDAAAFKNSTDKVRGQ